MLHTHSRTDAFLKPGYSVRFGMSDQSSLNGEHCHSLNNMKSELLFVCPLIYIRCDIASYKWQMFIVLIYEWKYRDVMDGMSLTSLLVLTSSSCNL